MLVALLVGYLGVVIFGRRAIRRQEELPTNTDPGSMSPVDVPEATATDGA